VTGWQDDVVGKRARMDRRSNRRIKVADAAEVVAALQSWARQTHGAGSAPDQWIQAAAGLMVERWADSPVVLRVDAEFAGALMNSNTDVELVPDWLGPVPLQRDGVQPGRTAVPTRWS
jgi:hypothetical protein